MFIWVGVSAEPDPFQPSHLKLVEQCPRPPAYYSFPGRQDGSSVLEHMHFFVRREPCVGPRVEPIACPCYMPRKPFQKCLRMGHLPAEFLSHL